MEDIEKEMRNICAELGIEVVPREENQSFFDEEEEVDLELLFKYTFNIINIDDYIINSNNLTNKNIGL